MVWDCGSIHIIIDLHLAIFVSFICTHLFGRGGRNKLNGKTILFNKASASGSNFAMESPFLDDINLQKIKCSPNTFAMESPFFG